MKSFRWTSWEEGRIEAEGDRPACKARTWTVFKKDWANVRGYLKIQWRREGCQLLVMDSARTSLGCAEKPQFTVQGDIHLVQDMLLELGKNNEDHYRLLLYNCQARTSSFPKVMLIYYRVKVLYITRCSLDPRVGIADDGNCVLILRLVLQNWKSLTRCLCALRHV
jgi:hypothetical protein